MAQGADAATDTAIAMIALKHPMLPNIERVIRRHADELGIAPDAVFEASETNILVPTGEGMLVLTLMSAPIPLADGWDDTAARAWRWPAASEAMEAQRAHLIVRLAHNASPPVHTHAKAALIVRDCLEQFSNNAIAVSWGPVLSSAQAFASEFDRCRADNELPMLLWVVIQLSSDGRGGTVLSTLGLNQFGLNEIEAKRAPMPPDTASGFVVDLAQDLLAHGTVLNDGDAVCGPNGDGVVVRHRFSCRRGVGRVYQLEFPNQHACPTQTETPNTGSMKTGPTKTGPTKTGPTKTGPINRGFLRRLFHRG